MENGFLKKAKQGLMRFRELKTKSGLRKLILEQIPFLEKEGREKEKKAREREVSSFGWDCFSFLASKRSSNLQEKI